MAEPALTYRIAETREDLEGALGLVYHNYVEKSYCKLNRFQMHFYLYDVLPETRTLVALDGEKVVGTLTLVFDSELGIPSESLYKPELDELRAAGRKLAEVSKLATDRELGRGQIVAVRGLFRLGWLLSAPVKGATDFCIMVEPHHEKFYRKAYLFDRLGEQREDPKAGGAPSALLRLNLETAPERFRENFGEKPQPRNLYWYNCVAPDLEDVRRGAAEADGRLIELNRRSKEAQRAQESAPSSRSMRRYVDFRMLALAFNVEKIGKEADEQRRKGLFDLEIEHYDRLLSIMPARYAPDRQAEICLKMAGAAWHCGLYEKLLELCRRARELTIDADVRANSFRLAAMGLHFLGNPEKAIAEITEGLEADRLSPVTRAGLLRTRARMHIESFRLDEAAEGLGEARELIAPLPESTKVNRLRAIIQHNLWILETHRGDYIAAGEALRAGARYLTDLNRMGTFHYHDGMIGVERAAGRPLEALAHAKQGLRMISPQADPFNAAILHNKRISCLLSMGDIDGARKDFDDYAAMAERSRHIGVIADAVSTRAMLMSAEDRIEAARAQFEKWIEQHDNEVDHRPRAQVLNSRAHLAGEAGDFDAAAAHLEEVEQLVAGMAEYRMLTRLSRVTTELQAGRAARAKELSSELVDPSRFPGHEVYRAGWSAAGGMLLLLDDPKTWSAAELIGGALDLDRRGEAWGTLASNAIQTLRAMTALELREGAPDVWDLAVAAAREATDQRRLPRAARLLHELTAS